MMTGHAEPETPFLVRRGIIHPPMLTWIWPGAQPMVIPEPIGHRAMVSHLVIRHGLLSIGHWKLPRLVAEHESYHNDDFFGHIVLTFDRVHVHEENIEEPDTWEW